jgi:D-alanyl-D-alanine carboxypeptidase (penicillin-binding protein 5/6)
MKRIIAIIPLCAVLTLSGCAKRENDVPDPNAPNVSAVSAIAYDLSSGKALFELKPEMALQPGSLVKLLTVYVALDELGIDGLDETVIVSKTAAESKGSTAGLKVGARLTLDDLLYCVLLPSGCDATVALAEHIAGSEAEMVNRINALARTLKLEHTNFADCTGIAYEQVTTARDMLTLTCALVDEYPELLRYTATFVRRVSYELDGQLFELKLQSTNKLLGNISGVIGLKTGTSARIYNAVIIAERDERQIAVVIIGAPDEVARTESAELLLEYAFGL